MPRSSTIISPPAVASYRLLIEPRKDLFDSIQSLQQEFKERNQTSDLNSMKPQLTILSFSQFTSFESRILQRLRSLSMQTAPFSVALENFASLPSHTIYIPLVGKSAFQNLVKHMRTSIQDLLKFDKQQKPLFITDPYIPIVQKLKPWQFEKGWLEYSQKTFSGRFIATEMTLIKKEESDTRYEILEKFQFQNIPIRAKQALLF